MHVAAAMAGVRRAQEGKSSPVGNADICSPRCLSCSLALILLGVGIGYLIPSFSNERLAMVHDFDEHVHAWTETERAKFTAWNFDMAASWNSGSDVASMDAIEETGFQLHDVERGDGVESYIPLVYSATLEFPADLDDLTSNLSALEYGAAPTAVFHFTARSMNGTVQVGSVEVPLLYSTLEARQTVQHKCWSLHRGMWHGNQCLVVRQLTQLCLQVEATSPGWQLRNSSGCYSSGPADYSPVTPQSFSKGGHHQIKVQLRSSTDPLITISRITHNSFNFGLSVAHQRLRAIMLLGAASLFCISPAYFALKKCRTSSSKVMVTQPAEPV